MPLTEEQLEHFYREGYVVVPGLVPREAIDAVRAAGPQQANADGKWQARSFDHKNPVKDKDIHQLLIEPHINEAITQIFGNTPRAFYGMLAVVPAHGGNGLPWHQDNQYEQMLGGALNTFVAISEITPDKAILWVSPQSHRAGTQPSKENTTTAPGHREAIAEPENGVPLPTLQPGDVCIFDRNTYHRSLTNTTDEDRWAYAAQYLSANARAAVTGKADPSFGHCPPVPELAALWKEHAE